MLAMAIPHVEILAVRLLTVRYVFNAGPIHKMAPTHVVQEVMCLRDSVGEGVGIYVKSCS